MFDAKELEKIKAGKKKWSEEVINQVIDAALQDK